MKSAARGPRRSFTSEDAVEAIAGAHPNLAAAAARLLAWTEQHPGVEPGVGNRVPEVIVQALDADRRTFMLSLTVEGLVFAGFPEWKTGTWARPDFRNQFAARLQTILKAPKAIPTRGWGKGTDAAPLSDPRVVEELIDLLADTLRQASPTSAHPAGDQ